LEIDIEEYPPEQGVVGFKTTTWDTDLQDGDFEIVVKAPETAGGRYIGYTYDFEDGAWVIPALNIETISDGDDEGDDEDDDEEKECLCFACGNKLAILPDS
jgi:hypothetical protein